MKDVALLAGPFLTVIQLDVDAASKPYPHYGQKVGLALAAYGVHTSSPYIIVVGPDIDPHDSSQVLWAVAMLSVPVSSAITVKKDFPGIGAMLGFHNAGSGLEPHAEQIIIDATTPVPERYDGWRPRSEPFEWEQQEIERIRKKLQQS